MPKRKGCACRSRRLEAVRRRAHRCRQGGPASLTSEELRRVHRYQREVERCVRKLSQGLPRQRRHRGERSNSMPAGGEMNMSVTRLVLTVLVVCISGPLFAQEWIEFANREDRFTCNFPTQPKVT